VSREVIFGKSAMAEENFFYDIWYVLSLASTDISEDIIFLSKDAYCKMNTLQTSIEQPDNSHEPLTPGTFILHGRVYGCPSLARRYKALVIDVLLIATTMTIALLASGESTNQPTILIGLAIAWTFYEPIFSAYGGTLGQRIMRIRVRDYNRPFKPARLWQVYIRMWTKGLLGWLSFLTVRNNREHRAIHDIASSTIVIMLV
jgi:uncharacterized RDD family membrane protein YckC